MMLETKVAVIGLGYVGLPVALESSLAGFRVTGIDISESVCRNLNSGISHIDDITDKQLNEMVALGFQATTNEKSIEFSDIVVVCVPTPLNDGGGPDLSSVIKAAEGIGNNIKPGTTVILESTTYPGTTEEIVKPILEKNSGLRAGKDFFLAFSPERIDPGNSKYTLSNTPKIVGGLTKKCSEMASEFYKHFVSEIKVAKNLKTAETAKLLENTYRHINIALVNEMAKFCHEMRIDIWDVIDCASTKPFGFQPFYPGPGVGGHCIPIDPNYLSYKVKSDLGYPFKFVELAEEINAGMPMYIFNRVQDLLNEEKKSINDSSVLILGVTYKENISDLRESPALPLAKKLIEKGANLFFHDPFVTELQVDQHQVKFNKNFPKDLSKFDLVILLQNHTEYQNQFILKNAKIIFDTRGKLTGNNIKKL